MFEHIPASAKWVQEYVTWRTQRLALVKARKLSVSAFLRERVEYLDVVQSWVVPEYWKMYDDGGRMPVLAAWVNLYLDMPADFPPERARYWRTRVILKMEELGGRKGLLVETLKGAGQDWEAALVGKVTGAEGEAEFMPSRGHAAGVEIQKKPGAGAGTPIIVKATE